MSHTVTLRAIGNSTGVILPRDLLTKLRLNEGDQVYITETPDGFMLRGYNPEFAAQMTVAEQIMREDRDALRKLAE